MTTGKGHVLTDPMNVMKKIVEGTKNGCVNFHRTSTLLDLIARDQNNPLTQE
jgi:hypothetical protein